MSLQCFAKSIAARALSVLLLSGMLALCAPPACPAADNAGEPSPAAVRTDLRGYSAWLPEWTLTGALREAEAQKRGLSSVQIFAAYFDEAGRPFLPDRIVRWIDEEAHTFRESFRQEPNGPRIPIYLSVVNDIWTPSGSTFKDAALVSRLVGTEASRKAHVRELLALVAKGKFDGLEIDYERVRDADWGAYLSFCSLLHEELEKVGKHLRVVLEPKKSYYTARFPEGPEYVVMAYNLFGSHSGPGPKANPDLIGRLANQTAAMKPRPRLALATGGFLWDTNKKSNEEGAIRQLTESEAHLLAQREGVKPARDEESGYLVFRFPKDAKRPSVVWFADGETLSLLARGAAVQGFADFALWSFWGNRRFSLDTWRTEVTK